MSSRGAETGSEASLTMPRDETRVSQMFAQPTWWWLDPDVAGTARLAARVAGALTVAVCMVGLVVRLAFAPRAGHWLAFPFAGIPARPAVAATVFLHDLRALSAVSGLLLVAQSPYWPARENRPGLAHRMLQRVGEALLAGAVAANVIVIGASVGAYGTRMIAAALPHGPVELAAYALAFALYMRGRHRPLSARHMIAVAALSVFVLAVAALLETFVNV